MAKNKGTPLFIRFVLRPVGHAFVAFVAVCLLGIAGGSKSSKKK